MKCKICKADSETIFQKDILLKYNVNYHQCSNCGFIQTDEVFWLDEAYNNAITSLDIGILNRNKFLLNEVSPIIDSCFPEAEIFLDFAGGYGLFVRSMRDLGYNFYRQDIYCENIFAKNFDIKDIKNKKFDVATAFEVFEHLENPIAEIENILEFSDHLIFSTDLVPSSDIENWIYIAHETGQHIGFYTEQSLEIIAKKLNKNYYHKNNLHLFTTKKLTKEQMDYAFGHRRIPKKFGIFKNKDQFRISRESYQHRDYLHIKEILRNNAKNIYQ